MTIGALLAVLVAGLAVVQIASDALNAGAAIPGTFPRVVPMRLAISVYRVLDLVAPAPYVEASLARAALERGDPVAAERYAARLPASPVRDELFADIALSSGQTQLAREYFLAAPDPRQVTSASEQLALRDPAGAYALEGLLEARLTRSGMHPDEVAETSWEMGRLANRVAWRQVPGSALQRAWLRRAWLDFEKAVALAPLSERYIVEDANQADLLGYRQRARVLFARAVDLNPASADAIAGLGVLAFQQGERVSALADLKRAQTIDPNALMVRALERDLR